MSGFAVKRWQFTLVVFLAFAALGLQSLFTIPKSEDPTFPFATFAVVAVLPGSSPNDVERLVVDPLETKLKSLSDVKSMKTEIDDGLALIRVEFNAGSDPTEKHDAVLRETTALRPTLPPELARLEVKQFNAANVNIVEVALVSETASYRDLDIAARALRRRLENLSAVGEVSVAGLPKQEVTVTLDLERMVALGVHPQEVLGAIGAESANVPAGSVEAGSRRFNVQTSGDYGSVDEIRSTIVRSAGGSSIRVSDIADVTYHEAEDAPFARFNGKRAVLIAAPQREGKNIFATKQAVDAELTSFASTLAPSIRLERGFDQSRNVEHRMSGFSRDFALAIFLVLLTLLPLGWRASIVVMVSIPLSLAMGLFFLQTAGFGINQLSIVGFVLALGLLVDDSVVVVENITRHIRHGERPVDAAIKATKQITVSVLGCTATLLFAFFPLLMLPGNAGQFIRSLPVAVVMTIAASLFVSLTVVPFLSSRLLVAESEHGNIFYRALTWVIEGSYRRILEHAMRFPKLTLVAGLAVFLAALALVPKIGFSLFPKAGVPQVLISIEGAEGSSLAETDKAARFVESVVAKEARVANVATTVGKGHPQVYYNIVGRNEGANVADVFVVLEGHEPPRAFIESVRAKLRDYPGPRFDVVEFENGPPLEAPIAIRLLGDDSEALERAADVVEGVLSGVEGTRDVRNPSHDRRTDLRVKVDRDKAAVLGVSPPEVDRAVRLAIGGVVAGKYRDATSDEARDIRVTLPRRNPGSAPDVGTLDRLYVGGQGGRALPLAQIASIAPEASPSKMRHYQKERSVTVTAQVREGYNTDRLTKAALAKLGTLPLPKGVRFEPAGELENRQESFGGLGAAIVIAIFGVLAILVLEFRTFKSTLIVASVLPLGIIGGLVALFVSGNTLSFTANIGFVALMGIEVKNSILLVDFTNQLREKGEPLDDAIRKAGEARFVPILLTTLTAIGGLIPLILERSSLYSPLAIVILGGLISSTLLARIITPVLYKLLAPEVRPSPADADEPTREIVRATGAA